MGRVYSPRSWRASCLSSTKLVIRHSPDMSIVAVILSAVLVALWGIVIFNLLVRDRNRVAAAWGDVDVQLKRRHDLIPNLVETVKQYAGYERGVLERVVAGRTQALTASTPAQKGGTGAKGARLGYLMPSLPAQRWRAP